MDKAEYLKVERKGRGFRLYQEQRAKMWDAMMANFTKHEMAEYVIGKTPILSTESIRVERWKEIRNWIEENEDLKIEKYIIIDDEWSMGELDAHFVKCWEHSGLSNDIKKKVLEMILN